jgi:hypothetical protein
MRRLSFYSILFIPMSRRSRLKLDGVPIHNIQRGNSACLGTGSV